MHTHRRADGTFVDERSRQLHEQMEAYLEEALTPFEDGTMPDAPLPQEIDKKFLIIAGGPRKGKVYGLSTIASTIYPQAMTPRPRGSASLSQSIYASREEARESQEEARAATQRAIEADERAVEARRECEELRSRVSSLEESVRLLLGGMPRGSHSDHSLHGRGSSQAGRGSTHTSKSSQGSREGSRASPMRSAHISRSFRGRAPSYHTDVHLSSGFGDENEYDDDETQP